jgi:hypothetical protein
VTSPSTIMSQVQLPLLPFPLNTRLSIRLSISPLLSLLQTSSAHALHKSVSTHSLPVRDLKQTVQTTTTRQRRQTPRKQSTPSTSPASPIIHIPTRRRALLVVHGLLRLSITSLLRRIPLLWRISALVVIAAGPGTVLARPRAVVLWWGSAAVVVCVCGRWGALLGVVCWWGGGGVGGGLCVILEYVLVWGKEGEGMGVNGEEGRMEGEGRT